MRMRLIDEKGRLFGKVSVIDVIILLTVIGLGLGFVYKKTSGDVQQILNADTTFYVTFVSEKVRDFSVAAVNEGDVFFKQYDRQPLGTAVRVESEQARDIMQKTDGTAVYAPVDGRFTMYITLECSGSITDAGYYINGNVPVAEGSEFKIQSNMMLASVMVYEINEEWPWD